LKADWGSTAILTVACGWCGEFSLQLVVVVVVVVLVLV
jgi:hypothetical protein